MGREGLYNLKYKWLYRDMFNKKEEKSIYDLSALPTVLLPWYDAEKRSLSWRDIVTPYRTWVSEIMLQQTRVQAVLPYFQRFMDAAPDIPTLAELTEERLLGLWQGLGYYSRARNLQKAARIVTEQYGGCLPDTYSELIKLPGIGDYTAGAILSIAFNKAIPAVDGNALRIVARLTACRDNVLDTRTHQQIRAALSAVMPPDRPGDLNQALMDLGAGICLPKNPNCESCPAANLCAARAVGIQGELPVREKNTARPTEARTVFVLTRPDGRTALCRRPEKGLLAGLWELPNVPGELTETLVAQQLSDYGLRISQWKKSLRAVHLFTHRRWEMTGWLLTVEGDGPREWVWVDEKTLKSKAIPSAFKAFTAALEAEKAGKIPE